MHQVNLDPELGTERGVRRRPVFVAPTPRYRKSFVLPYDKILYFE